MKLRLKPTSDHRRTARFGAAMLVSGYWMKPGSFRSPSSIKHPETSISSQLTYNRCRKTRLVCEVSNPLKTASADSSSDAMA